MLGKRNPPVVCENGAIIFFPNDTSKKTISFLSEDQRKEFNKLQDRVSKIRLKSIFAASEVEVLMRNHRMTSIDFRIQHKITKVGIPDLYGELSTFIESQFDLDSFSVVSSLNSLSIQLKNINKLVGVKKAIELLGLKRNEIFLIGMGDAPNDKELLEGADLSIAVREGASQYAKLFINQGDVAAIMTLNHIK